MRAIVHVCSRALVGLITGLFSGAVAGVIIGVVSMVIFHIFLNLTVDDPTPDDSLPILYPLVAGAATGLLLGVPIVSICGVILGIVVRGLRGVIIGVALGAFAGALASIAVVMLGLILNRHGIHLPFTHYVAYGSLWNGIIFNTVFGAVVGIGAGLYIGRRSAQ